MPDTSLPDRKILSPGELHLDPLNPRLPEQLRGSDQVTLLKYLSDHGVLDEILRSLHDNGFFPHEPLIAFKDPDDGFVVLEGNRRLAALMVYTGAPEALDLGLAPQLDEAPTQEQLDRVSEVPVYVVPDKDAVHRYLGFRHIGGIKTWPAEAKARYLLQESDKAAELGVDSPFLDVARRVGSNSQGVRNAYSAVAILHRARDEFGLDVAYVIRSRFGVWSRCMSTEVRDYIGFGRPKTYPEVRGCLEDLKETELREVLGDLTPNGKRAVLRDSRDATVYGQILLHKTAHEVLRKYADIQVARQVVEDAALPQRIRELSDRVDVAREDAVRAEYSDELRDAADTLNRAARALRGTVRGLVDVDEDDE